MINHCSASTTFIRGFYTSKGSYKCIRTLVFTGESMKLITPFSIPKPEMNELCRIHKAAKKKTIKHY